MTNQNMSPMEDLLSLLERTKNDVIKEIETLGKGNTTINPSMIEELVLARMKKAATETRFKGAITRGSLHAFPDIIVDNKYGVEVKMTVGDKWKSTGNSIMESTRDERIEKVFLFFIKIGGKVDVKYRLYQECLNNIAVTHSPRYMIDMNLAAGESIFDKIGVKYEELRRSQNPVRYIKNYYKNKLSEGEELWWIDQESSSEPIIRNFSNLSEEEQNEFIVNSMIFFPEIFGRNNLKFSRPAVYLFTEYNAISSNIRDKFTAGGRATVEMNGNKIKIPKILHKLLIYSKNIKANIEKMDKAKLAHFWRVDKIDAHSLNQWKELLDSKSTWSQKGVKASDLFIFGLHEKSI